VHNPGNNKLEPRAFKGILLGYTESVKDHRIWNSKTKMVINSCHVIFDESDLFKENVSSSDVLDLVHSESKEKRFLSFALVIK